MTPVKACVDSNNGALSEWDDDCTLYTETPMACGKFGDSDFDSDTMCCTCGGGINGNITDILNQIRQHPWKLY